MKEALAQPRKAAMQRGFPAGAPPLWSGANSAWANRVPDIFDEVDEDLRADKARAMLRRYGGVLVLAMLLTLAGVGVYHTWQQRQQAAAEAIASKFIAAQKAAAAKPPAKNLSTQFADIAATAPDGYRTLARLQMAAAEWNSGQHDSAVAEWQAIADDSTAASLLRDLATLNSVRYQVDSGDPKILKAKLVPLVQGTTRWRPLAEELSALLDLRLGHTKEAREIMKQLMLDPQSPPGVRQIAQALLTTLGDDTDTASAAGKHG
jgi:hypothetical protein